MDRVNGHDHVDIGGGRRGFVAEDLVNGVIGTEITADWLNSVQEELAAVIEDAGLVLDPDDNTQLLQALLRREIARAQPFIPVISITSTAPPGAPAIGDAYVIPPAATGAWAGRSQQLAEWSGSAWRFTVAANGHVVGLPDGRQYTRLAGTYYLRANPVLSAAFVPVLSVSISAPPGAPAIGDLYAIAAGASGAWAGKSHQVAEWNGAAWRFIETPNGHVVGTPSAQLWIKKSGVYVPFRRALLMSPLSFYMGQL